MTDYAEVQEILEPILKLEFMHSFNLDTTGFSKVPIMAVVSRYNAYFNSITL